MTLLSKKVSASLTARVLLVPREGGREGGVERGRDGGRQEDRRSKGGQARAQGWKRETVKTNDKAEKISNKNIHSYTQRQQQRAEASLPTDHEAFGVCFSDVGLQLTL